MTVLLSVWCTLCRLLLWSVLLLGLGVRSASAEPADAAESALREGVELRRQGRDQEALAAFQRAYTLEPTWRARAQIALAEQALGHWVEAESALAQALEEGAEDAWIRRNREPLEMALETTRNRLGTLEIESNALGGEVYVNGASVGPVPLTVPLRVTAGEVKVEVRGPGDTVIERLIEVPARGQVKASITVIERPREAGAPAPLAAVPALASPPDPTGGTREQRPLPAVEEPSRTWRTFGWVALGTGGVLLAAGAAGEIVSAHQASIYNDDGRCFSGELTREQRCGSHRRAAETAETLGISGLAVGGASLLTGAILLLSTRAKSRPKSPLALGAAPGFWDVRWRLAF